MFKKYKHFIKLYCKMNGPFPLPTPGPILGVMGWGRVLWFIRVLLLVNFGLYVFIVIYKTLYVMRTIRQ